MSLPIHHIPRGRRPHPLQPLPGDLGLGLLRGRVHEFCGPARLTLVTRTLALCVGPVLWITPAWLPERPFPGGLSEAINPGRLIFVRPRRPEDMLWALEEGLRSGVVPMVLADLPEPPPLTPVRRLHLAAEAGANAAATQGTGLPPLGLLLTPGMGGAQGVESRWHLAPAPSGSTLRENQATWTLERLRARLAPPGRWRLQYAAGGRLTGSALAAD